MDDRRKDTDGQDTVSVTKERRMGDRRDSHRIPITVEVAEGNGPFQKQQGNISIGGVYFEKPLALPTGAVLQLRFTLPDLDHVLEVRAEVVEITAVGVVKKVGTRVRFIELDTRSELLIARFLDQHPQG